MSGIKYQFGAIAGAAADINSTSGRINGLLGDLKATLQPMVSTWEEIPLRHITRRKLSGIRRPPSSTRCWRPSPPRSPRATTT